MERRLINVEHKLSPSNSDSAPVARVFSRSFCETCLESFGWPNYISDWWKPPAGYRDRSSGARAFHFDIYGFCVNVRGVLNSRSRDPQPAICPPEVVLKVVNWPVFQCQFQHCLDLNQSSTILNKGKNQDHLNRRRSRTRIGLDLMLTADVSE